MQRLFRSSNPFQLSPLWKIISYTILGIWGFIVLFPLYWLFVTSFKQPIDVSSGPKYVPFVDFQPSMHAWQEMLVDNGPEFVGRPYMMTFSVGVSSALLALAVGSGAAYALTRFQYQPKPGLVLTFIGCIGFMGVIIYLGTPWQLAVPIGIVLFFFWLKALAAVSKAQ